MIDTYTVTGMTCGNCEARVKSSLLTISHVLSVEVSKENHSATIEMDKHIPLHELQKALGGEGSKYKISTAHHNETTELAKSWINTYKPVFLIFGYILAVTLLVQLANPPFSWMHWMNHFMAGFFLVFSFFKLLNLQGFAESYAMYDIVAKQWKAWGYVYAFAELGLGIAFLTGFNQFFTNSTTLLLMSVSLIGVLQSVLNKRKIKCACLGDVFNLPMSNITIIEDVLMISMSGTMLLIF